MIDPNETPTRMVERVVESVVSVERKFGAARSAVEKFADEFGSHLDKKDCVMSTPIINNAGRYAGRPLSACTVPPVDLNQDISRIKKIVDRLHADAMGTGFNLDSSRDPIGVLKALNAIAVSGARSGREDRPVGNMAILSSGHRDILDFIDVKVGGDKKGEEWKFNLSVNASDEFMEAAKRGAPYRTSGGKILNAQDVLHRIVSSAHACGDPGLVFLHRMEADNPTPGVGHYVSTAPCGEVGLAPGETCQFGYVNLGNFVVRNPSGVPKVDFGKLERVARLLTHVLDNALELSIERYGEKESRSIMSAKRKIGVGVCGLADLLVKLKIPYASREGRELARNIVAFVNYYSKIESFELAKKRGSFGAMRLPAGCRYNELPGFIETKYGNLETPEISGKDWISLGEKIRETKLLRNASTTALPPTGRSALVIDATPGIEPLFPLNDYGGVVNRNLMDDLRARRLDTPETLRAIARSGKIGDILGIDSDVKSIYSTALEIAPEDHLKMVHVLQRAVDESISKTVNIPEATTPEEIMKTYLAAYDLGLKGITVFRTGSRTIQPRELAKP